MPIAIEDLKNRVEQYYVGFSPDTTSVKPVHIANGLFRAALGSTSNVKLLNSFVIDQTQKGKIPKGHALADVYEELCRLGRLDQQEINVENIKWFRPLLLKVVAADGAVFTGGMESYSAGYVGFVSKDRIAQDGGELVVACLQRWKSPLLSCIVKALQDKGDTVSLLSAPLLNPETEAYSQSYDYDNLAFLNSSLPTDPAYMWEGLRDAAETLAQHLEAHPNKLLRLRLSVLFSSFVLVRHLTSLEACYLTGEPRMVPPFLLDFSRHGSEPITRASLETYIRACQSVSRFYAWAFGVRLRELYSAEELCNEETPKYKGSAKSDLQEIWKLALQQAVDASDPFTIYGQALYDMLAMEAEGNPISYMRRLGLLSGLLWPPNQSAQSFALKQDMVETLVRGAVRPGESIDISRLQDRFWERYRIIVGGSLQDEQRLTDAGVYQVDSDSLKRNYQNFAVSLGRLDFARQLADGVLQVEVMSSRVS